MHVQNEWIAICDSLMVFDHLHEQNNHLSGTTNETGDGTSHRKEEANKNAYKILLFLDLNYFKL
jgi:hypothetical protein